MNTKKLLAEFFIVVFLAACGGGGDDDDSPPPYQPSIADIKCLYPGIPDDTSTYRSGSTTITTKSYYSKGL